MFDVQGSQAVERVPDWYERQEVGKMHSLQKRFLPRVLLQKQRSLQKKPGACVRPQDEGTIMTYIMVDIEADGPIPGDYSMISFGAVVVEPELDQTFYGTIRPVSEKWVPEALAVSGFTREETLKFLDGDPTRVMQSFADWLKTVSGNERLFFISDNNGFDWQFINWYFHHFLGDNPFGHSSTNLGSLYKGMQKSCFKNFKHLRKTKHTHHPVDDAKGNAEALLYMKYKMGLGIKL
jgi:hypothetical protein